MGLRGVIAWTAKGPCMLVGAGIGVQIGVAAIAILPAGPLIPLAYLGSMIGGAFVGKKFSEVVIEPIIRGD